MLLNFLLLEFSIMTTFMLGSIFFIAPFTALSKGIFFEILVIKIFFQYDAEQRDPAQLVYPAIQIFCVSLDNNSRLETSQMICFFDSVTET